MTIDDELDRIYHGARRPSWCAGISRDKSGHVKLPDVVVVWNPGGTSALAQRHARRWLPTHALRGSRAAVVPLELAPGAEWWGRRTLVAM